VLFFSCPNVFRGFGGGKFDFSAPVGTLVPESDEVFIVIFFGNVCRCGGGCVHPR
jgi:hypothetical protein